MSDILLGGSISTTGTPILGTVDIVLSDANHTLSVSEYTNNFINVTGTLSTSRNIVLPLVKGLSFIINNATTGGFSIQAIGATGSGQTVNNGNRLLVVCDGTNYLTISIIDTVGGDLGDFLPNPTVRKLWNVSIPQVSPSNPTATTGFVVGNLLQITNVSANNQALGYGALNLGNGSTSTNTSGTLPVARQAPQSLTGDLSGFANSTGSSFNSNSYGAVVIKIQQTPIQALSLTSQQDGYVLTYSNTNGRWEPQSSLTGASLSGDVTGQPGTNTLSKIQTKNLVVSSPLNGHVLTFNNSLNRWENQDHSMAGDLTGTLSNTTVAKIRNNPVLSQSLSSAQDGYILTWDNSSGAWKADVPAGGSLPGGTAAGDLSGFYPNPSVIAINGTSVPSTPNPNTVLKAATTSSSIWGFIVEANITGGTITNTSINNAAAIAGTKISPNFGSQAITTTSNITSSAATITAPTFGVNNGSTIPTITSGTGVPATTPPNGSVFYRTDGTDVSAIYTRQSSAWFPVGAAAAGTAGGDLSGNYPNPTVIAIQQNHVNNTLLSSTQDGYVLTWVNANNEWQAKASASASSFTAGGDLSGTNTSQNVIKIHGASVPIAGSLTTGNGLYVTGTSTLSYAALNLAGGSNFVTGALPTANQVAQSLTGDASGTTATIQVDQARGLKSATTTVSVSSATAPTLGQVLTAINGTSASWQTPVTTSAVIFDGSTNPENIRVNRATLQSPIDNTKVGVVNLGSKSSGSSTGVTNDYGTNGGGDKNQVDGYGSTVCGGTDHSTASDYNFIGGGYFNATSSLYAGVAFGSSNTANAGASTVSGGNSNTASGICSVVIGGEQNIASGVYGISNGAYSHASRDGEYAHASKSFSGNPGAGDAQYSRLVMSGVSSNGSPVLLSAYSTNPLNLVSGFAYAIKITCVAALNNKRAMFIHEVLAYNEGSAIIDIDNLSFNGLNGTSWVFDIGASGNNLTLSFTGEASVDVRAVATVDITMVKRA